jgi:hypothetical protein
MAVQTDTRMHHFFGLVMWGDLGPLTMYRSHRGRLVIFKKTWPDTPPTPRQVAARESMTACGRSWRGLSESDRQQWQATARQLSLPCSGYNLWVAWRFGQRLDKLRTIINQSGRHLQLNASLPTPIDPAYTARITRPHADSPDPWIWQMPATARAIAEQETTTWFLPWNSNLAYAAPLNHAWLLTGPGSLTTVAAANKQMIPAAYTPPAGQSSATIRLTCFWPDGTFTNADQWVISGPL